MPRSFALSALMTRAKERSDLENSSHIAETEWKGYLSTAYAQLHSILVASGYRYFESTQSIDSASLADAGDGGGSVALPADFLNTTFVYYQDGAGHRYPLVEIMAQEAHVFSGNTGSQGEAYALVATNLIIYPKPPSGQTYKHVYVPQPLDLSGQADGTVIDVVTPDGEDYLTWTAAMFALTKEESDTSVCERYRALAKERLEEQAVLRSLNTPRRRMVDDGYGWPVDEGDWRYGR